VTTEDDFQRALDADPDDHHTRLVFADWLDERDDPRAEGYRALGATRRDCTYGNMYLGNREACPFWQYLHGAELSTSEGCLPKDWYDLVEFNGKYAHCCPSWQFNYTANRRELEDAAALAFCKLSAARRRELLTG
jgi:uncharacterized protein (TIGR02996 family)